jgi:hypothetical protein
VLAISCGKFVVVLLIFKDLISFWMKQKKFKLGFWQLIKPTAPCKPYSDLNKFIKTR